MARTPWVWCLLLGILLPTWTASSTSSARADPRPATAEQGWGIGEKAEIPEDFVWIRREPLEEASAAPITALTFWSSHDPVSLIVIARQDSLAARYPERLRAIAVSIDPPSLTRRFLGDRGAGNPLWPHVQIACDRHARVFEEVHRSIADYAVFFIPLTTVLSADGTVLWTGFPVQKSAPSPTAVFDAAINQILMDRYSLSAARADDDRQKAVGRLIEEIREAHNARDLARTDTLLSRIERIGVPEAQRPFVVSVMNTVAWELPTKVGRTERDLAVAERASRLGWDCGGSEDAAFADTRARVLHELGRVAEAVAIEEKAVELSKDAPDADYYTKTLARYRQALESPAPAGATIWSGSVNDAFATAPPVLVIPPGTAAGNDSLWAAELGWILKFDRPLVHADAVSGSDLASRTLVLYGTPADNPMTGRVLEAEGIGIDSTGIRFGSDHIPAPDPFLIVALPSPWTPGLPVVVYTAARPEHAHGLNRMFHGPTQVVVGTVFGTEKRVIASGDFDSVPPPDSGAVVFHAPPGAIDSQAPPWSGSLNDAVTRFDRDRLILRVRPDAADRSRDDSLWSAEMAGLSSRFGGGTRPASEVPPEARGGKVLVLYGNAATNPITRDVLETYDIHLEREGVRFGDRLIPAANPVLITCLPSPWDTPYPVELYTSFRDEDAHGLNRLFHGPTQTVIGRAGADGGLERVASFDYREVAPGRAIPDLPGPELSSAEAIEDLDALSDMLSDRYAGFRDLEARLRASGSSWGERRASFEERIRARHRWRWLDFVELLKELLDPVQDAHFALEWAGPTEDGTLTSATAQFVRGVRPFFTDLAVERGPQGLRVASAPEAFASLIGSPPTGVEPIGDPYEVEMGAAYLFPTLPGAAGAERYLLGVMATAPDAPSDVLVRFGPDGREVRLPLHRGRMSESILYTDAERGAAGGCPATVRPGSGFDLCRPPGASVPWLALRSMVEDQVRGLAETADSLRSSPAFVLDLRGNGGGSDVPGTDWMARLSAQPLRMMGSIQSDRRNPDALKSIMSVAFAVRQGDPSATPDAPAGPYEGKAAVLIDRRVASSGETMTQLAGQLSGAKLMGENSAGCVSYGNVGEHGPLPHSRIRLRFGRSRFVLDAIRPNREGVGFFPDYWLDEADPIAPVSEWLTAGRDR